jgi:hypothetical protein
MCLASVLAADRGATALALWSSFASGLNDLLYMAAALALAGGVCAVLLIRSKDFVKRDSGAPRTVSAPASARR